jgi:energy-coupling factor transporter ATP-binding protein EcfA2
MEFRALLPGRSDRVALIGTTGSGKTTLAEQLLPLLPYVVVYDTKGRINWGPRWHLHRNFDALRKDSHRHLVFRPDYAQVRNVDAVDRFFAWIFARGNTTVYADEVTDFCQQPTVYPFQFGRCITRGRELGVTVWCGSQRPAGIPKICLTESETTFVFFLKSFDDRKRVADDTGLDVQAIFDLDKHYFYVVHQSEKRPHGPHRLVLPARPRAHHLRIA